MAETLLPLTFALLVQMAVAYGLLRVVGWLPYRMGPKATHILIWSIFALTVAPFVAPLFLGLRSGGLATFHALMTPLIFFTGGFLLAAAYALFHSLRWVERRRPPQLETGQGT